MPERRDATVRLDMARHCVEELNANGIFPTDRELWLSIRTHALSKGAREVGVEFEPRQMGKPVDPCLGVGLRALDGAYVVRLAVIYNGRCSKTKTIQDVQIAYRSMI